MMTTNKSHVWTRYLGIAAAVFVPAMVIAQQLPPDNTFTPNALLRAESLEQMRDALAVALDRINALEQQRLTRENLYEVRGEAPLSVAGGSSTAQAVCNDNDVLLNCSCHGELPPNGTNSTVQTLTRIVTRNTRDGSSSDCVCQAEIAASGRVLVADATCLLVP
jgi:hypothetical protein